jgi:uncharacterized protein
MVVDRSWTRVLALALMIVFSLPIARWEFVYWAMAAAIIAFVLFVERAPLSSIGLTRPRWSTLLYGVLGGAVALGGTLLLYYFVLPRFGTADYGAKLGAVTALPFALRVEIVLRAAIFEEIFYRGFMIERLTPILRSRWVAALVSLVAFVAAHLGYWGWDSLLTVGWGGLVLTALYLWRRDLVANMLAHGLTDAIALLT